MNARPNVFGLPGGPLMQVVSGLVFALLLIVAVVLGAAILAAIVGVAVLAWIVFSVRLWWLRRKLGPRGAVRSPGEEPTRPEGRLIDAEYTVLGERDSSPGRPGRAAPPGPRDGDAP
jgi:uncharacterized iron-regulated membrane protein